MSKSKLDADELVSALEFFEELEDPHSHVNRLHGLGDILVICVCAVICGADGPKAIGIWAQAQEASRAGRWGVLSVVEAALRMTWRRKERCGTPIINSSFFQDRPLGQTRDAGDPAASRTASHSRRSLGTGEHHRRAHVVVADR